VVTEGAARTSIPHDSANRRALYDERTGERLGADEAADIVAKLLEQHARPEYHCRFRWERGSVAFWDNRAVQHYASSDYFPHRRVLRRVTVSGDVPYYDPASQH
jgi:taurine dioxygenase